MSDSDIAETIEPQICCIVLITITEQIAKTMGLVLGLSLVFGCYAIIL